jgi:probable rRNA maturation factor
MLDILNTAQQKISFQNKEILMIKNQILGKNYELSIVIVGDKKIQNLNKKFRNKNYPTDTLSFSISKNMGEIFINLKIANKKSISFQMSPQKYFYYLLIHSMLHLKGFDHGEKMEREEKQLIKKFLNV